MKKIINETTFNQIVKFTNNIKPYLELWRIQMRVNIMGYIYLDEVDTSIESHYLDNAPPSAGTITQINDIGHQIEISFWQKEEDEWIINSPYIPDLKFNNSFKYRDLDFYQSVIIKALEDTPDPSAWNIAQPLDTNHDNSKFEKGDIRDKYFEMLKFMYQVEIENKEATLINYGIDTTDYRITINKDTSKKNVRMRIINDQREYVFDCLIDGFTQTQLNVIIQYFTPKK